jgi:hypothetical protein
LHYGSRHWFRSAEDRARFVAEVDGFFNPSVFLHVFGVEVHLYDETICAMLRHEARFLANE